MVCYDTIRTLLAVATSEGMKIKRFDVKTAFLYGELEEAYLEQPEGFDDGSGRVCQLKRSLYGLKQAPRCWNKRFIGFMEKARLKNSTADPCLFYRTHGDTFFYIAIYVDEGLVVGNNDEEIQVFLRLLQEEFEVTIGLLENFLGIQNKCQSDGSIFVNQEAYKTRYCKSLTWLKQKVCRLLPVVKKVITTKMSVARFHIRRQWAVSCI